MLYAAAKAARCDLPAFARELLGMADLDSVAIRPVDARIELYAVRAVIRCALEAQIRSDSCTTLLDATHRGLSGTQPWNEVVG